MNLAIQMKMIDTFSTAYVKSAFFIVISQQKIQNGVYQ